MKQNDEFRMPTKEDVLRHFKDDCTIGDTLLYVGVHFFGMMIALGNERYAEFSLEEIESFLAYGMAIDSPIYNSEEQIGHITYSGEAIMVRSMHGIYFKLFHFKQGNIECVAVLDVCKKPES